MIVPKHIHTLAAGLLLTLAVASIGLQFPTVEAHPVESVQSIAQEFPLAAQAPVVRDHRTPRTAESTERRAMTFGSGVNVALLGSWKPVPNSRV